MLLLDSDDEQEDIKVAPTKEAKVDDKIRNYRVYVTYDMYYNTPRFWLSGQDF